MQKTLLMCGLMLDINKMRRQLDEAVERFVQGTLSVALEFYSKAAAEQQARAAAAAAAAPKPRRARKAAVQRPRSTTSGFRAPLVPVASEEFTPPPVRQKPKGPTPEKIAAGVLKLTVPSPTGFTFDQLAGNLRVAPEALQPVLDQLVADQKVRVVTEGEATLYRRPRIEPIRRRRDEPQA